MFSQIFSKTAKLYKQTLLYLIGIHFLTSISLTLFNTLLFGVGVAGLYNFINQFGINGVVTAIIIISVAVLIFLYVNLISSAASILIINTKDRGKKISFKQILKTSHKFVRPLFLYLFILSRDRICRIGFLHDSWHNFFDLVYSKQLCVDF